MDVDVSGLEDPALTPSSSDEYRTFRFNICLSFEADFILGFKPESLDEHEIKNVSHIIENSVTRNRNIFLHFIFFLAQRPSRKWLICQCSNIQ